MTKGTEGVPIGALSGSRDVKIPTVPGPVPPVLWAGFHQLVSRKGLFGCVWASWGRGVVGELGEGWGVGGGG